MTWYYDLSIIDLVFLLLFAGLYLYYIVRVIRIASALKSPVYRVFYKVLLRSGWFGLLIFALLGPSFGESTTEVKSVGKDIYICLDLSQSMNAFDIQPTRLEKLKYELKEIVEAFASDRIGLIIFSSEAFVQCPLTYDQSALNLWIDALNTNLVPNAGTDFGPPLKLALSKINEESSASQNHKVIVLISDGEDFGEETGERVAQINEEGIKLFTLGIGTAQGGKIMTRNGFKQNRQGEDVVTRLNPESLTTLALKTGGTYFEINGRVNEVEKLINTIKKIEGELRDSKQLDVADNKYTYFLALALILLALDVLITVKTIKL